MTADFACYVECLTILFVLQDTQNCFQAKRWPSTWAVCARPSSIFFSTRRWCLPSSQLPPWFYSGITVMIRLLYRPPQPYAYVGLGWVGSRCSKESAAGWYLHFPCDTELQLSAPTQILLGCNMPLILFKKHNSYLHKSASTC